MIGMDGHTGRKIEGAAHLAQSLRDILTTPKGSLVMQRAYGSDLPGIIDQPLNAETLMDLYMASAEAITLWEPRISLTRVQVVSARAGRLVLELLDANGTAIPLPITLDAGAAA